MMGLEPLDSLCDAAIMIRNTGSAERKQAISSSCTIAHEIAVCLARLIDLRIHGREIKSAVIVLGPFQIHHSFCYGGIGGREYPMLARPPAHIASSINRRDPFQEDGEWDHPYPTPHTDVPLVASHSLHRTVAPVGAPPSVLHRNCGRRSAPSPSL